MKNMLNEKKIIEDYQHGKSTIMLGKENNCRANKILAILEKHNVNRRKAGARINDLQIREDYFSKIDTEIKSYFLGYLFADGFVTKNGYYLAFDLSIKDEYIIDKLLEEIYVNRKPKKYYKTINDKTYVKACISSKRIASDLLSLGMREKTELPNIDKKLFPAFVRGILDGDGSITFNKNRPYVFFLGEKSLLISLRKRMIKDFGIKKTKIFELVGVYRLSISSVKDCYLVLSNIYKKSTVNLYRKRERFDKLLTACNIPKHLNKTKSSKYVGVSFDKSRKLWKSYFGNKLLGRFTSERKAYSRRKEEEKKICDS